MSQVTESTWDDDRPVRLRSDVRRASRHDVVILISGGGAALRVSNTIEGIWPSLVEGAHFDDLALELQKLHPLSSNVRGRLAAFLDQLRRSGLLEESGAPPAQPKSRTIASLQIDRLAKPVAAALALVPRWLLYGAIVAAVCAAVALQAQLLARGDHPRFSDVFHGFTWLGLPIALLTLAPLHELGHAVMCRLAGVAAGPLKIVRGPLSIPRLYVETPEAALLASRLQRMAISSAGIISDTMLGGAAAWLLLHGASGVVRNASTFVVLYSLMMVNAATSPLQESDGSHLLEAAMNDESLRRAAVLGKPSRFSSASNIIRYRTAAAFHLILTVALLCYMAL